MNIGNSLQKRWREDEHFGCDRLSMDFLDWRLTMFRRTLGSSPCRKPYTTTAAVAAAAGVRGGERRWRESGAS